MKLESRISELYQQSGDLVEKVREDPRTYALALPRMITGCEKNVEDYEWCFIVLLARTFEFAIYTMAKNNGEDDDPLLPKKFKVYQKPKSKS